MLRRHDLHELRLRMPNRLSQLQRHVCPGQFDVHELLWDDVRHMSHPHWGRHRQLQRDTSRMWPVLRRDSSDPDALQPGRQRKVREHDERPWKLRDVWGRLQHEPRDTVVRRFQVYHHRLRGGLRRLRQEPRERVRNRFEHECGKLRCLRAGVQYDRRRGRVRGWQVHGPRVQRAERQL